MFCLSGQSCYEVLWTPPKKGNAYYILTMYNQGDYIDGPIHCSEDSSSGPE